MDFGATDWNIENDEAAKPDDIAIPGYAAMIMKADELKQAVDIGNPAENSE